MDLTLIRERFLRDNTPIRLGGIAANMARIKSFADHAGNEEAVRGLIEETKFLIEWCAPSATLNLQADLAQLQLELALWERTWDRIWSSDRQCAAMRQAAGEWSQKLLKLSGLLP